MWALSQGLMAGQFMYPRVLSWGKVSHYSLLSTCFGWFVCSSAKIWAHTPGFRMWVWWYTPITSASGRLRQEGRVWGRLRLYSEALPQNIRLIFYCLYLQHGGFKVNLKVSWWILEFCTENNVDTVSKSEKKLLFFFPKVLIHFDF